MADTALPVARPRFSLGEALAWLGEGARLQGDDREVEGVCTDTRAVWPGALFVALAGERFDAHDFLGQARAAGAGALLVSRPDVDAGGLPVIRVPDTLVALGALAAGWRARFALPVVAVTGSNGKTTVKEMIASILAAAHGEAGRLATRGNLNNEVGVPLTLFGLTDAHRAAVVELGMNHPGEIARLAAMSRPTVALVNNAQREHQEFMKSVEAVARENGSVIAALGTDGVAVFPGDDAHASVWREIAGARRCLEFGFHDGAFARAAAGARPEDFTMHLAGRALRVRLAIAGTHNVRNALAAAACAHAAGLSHEHVVAGLAAFRPAPGRLVNLRTATGAVLIDDSYNANPDSVRAAIDVLAAHDGPRVLALGDMGEVGDEGPRFHAEVGGYARTRGVQALLCLGEAARDAAAAFGAGAEHFDAPEALATRAAALATPDAIVLVKGSRFMRMERIVAALRAPVAGGAA